MSNNTENNPNITLVSTQKDEFTRIEIRDHITRNDVRAEKNKIFLFGDNLAQRGFGGQAAEMRGEENSLGIPTKKLPSNSKDAFFTDKEFAANIKAIDEAFGKIPPDKIVVIPKAGLGTGLAGLEEKAPQTFAYLNEKLSELGFKNPSKETAKNLYSKSANENKVIVQNVKGETPTAKRLLDLNNIQTNSLKILSPTEKEIDALKIDRQQALADYAERLRQDYKSNKDNFRDGLRLLSDSLGKGEQITVACSCRNGAMCHADVVKMAVEKVNAHLKNTTINKENRNAPAERLAVNSQTKQISQGQNLNPRTQRAINEILSFSENDRVLEKINETDGRNRSEQASYLGQFSQLTRDIYERGANVVDGNLIVPQEKLTDSQPLAITTESYAVNRLDKILHNEERAKELAPMVVKYGNKIGGITADGETKLKIFGWMYESLEGKTDFGAREVGEKPKFEETLEKIKSLAEEMHSLEPLDKTEFVPLSEVERGVSNESLNENIGDILNQAEIYEEAINLETAEQKVELEPSEKINTEGFDRIELKADVPRIHEDYTPTEITELINQTLPEIDRQLENGITAKEILAPFNEAIRQSASDDAQKRLDSIYQKQRNNRTETPQSNQSLEQQPAKIDLRRQNVIELKSPSEYLSAEKEAINTFYRQQKQEVGNLLTKIDEVRNDQTTEKTEEIALKKELNQIKEAKPNFAFKLERSTEIVVGFPSQESVESRNFVSSYINYQLKQPESRLRSENERYRVYAKQLESAATRDDVMKTSAEIRAENASLGLKWKDLTNSEKERLPRPLTSKEMQFLFTESSPAHYTNEMTAARLSFAHSGASRRAMTESLLKGEITPSPETQKLIESLESRLQRREIKDSLLATKHFFESVKMPNDALKHKNNFDHREIYQKLPPQEKDFVYQKATQQKENLEYRLAFKNERLQSKDEISISQINKQETGEKEKSFHILSQFNQARILGSKIESPIFTQKEISETNVKAITVLLKNQPSERLQIIGQELQNSQNIENKTVGEVLQTFARAEISQIENKTNITIKLPEKALGSIETYRELLEKFYPDDTRENEKFKFENFSDKEISRAREKGQDETLQNFREELKENVYQNDDSGKVIETETAVHEKLDKIAKFQVEARNAWRENESIIQKYVARANTKTRPQNREIPSKITQKDVVSAALGKNSTYLPANKTNEQFLQAVQKEITITDLNKFTANENFLGEAKFYIKNEFAEISESLKVLEESKLKTSKVIEPAEKEQIFSNKNANQELAENKPLSLRIFEKELEKAEKKILGESLKEKLSANTDLEKAFDPKTVFSNEERTAIKSKAIEAVKEKLEPKELNADNRQISPEASRQAFATYKQFERASNLWQTSDDKSKVTEAFSKLDKEAAKLNQIRQDYNRNEKMALLRDGIKSDLMNLFGKNSDIKGNNLLEQTKEIIGKNLSKNGFTIESPRVLKISREIGEKLETKQFFASKEAQKIGFTASKETQISGKIYEAATEKLKPKYEQTKEFFLRSR